MAHAGPLGWNRRAIVTLQLTSLPASAQNESQLIPLDDLPEGTPAEVVLMEDSSGRSTHFRLTIHGFWMEMVVGPDQRTYNRLTFPGLGLLNVGGAPELPDLRLRIAVPTTASTLTLESSEIIEQQIYQDILPYPQPVPEQDDGEPERWLYDEAIYEGDSVFPSEVLPPSARTKASWRTIPDAELHVDPVQWNPVTSELRVISVQEFTYSHEGPDIQTEPMTRYRERLASHLYDNWSVVGERFSVDTTEYVGSFLFVCPVAWADTLHILANQKRARGFHVTERYLPEMSTTCTEVRQMIGTWYATAESRGDAYVMLIGDHDVIPMCYTSTTYHGYAYTDDLFASTDGDDLDEEVFLGRLSVNDAADLGRQIRKILAYENEGVWSGQYRDVLLVAHYQEAPGKYEGAMEQVRTAVYSLTPNFLTCYGSRGDENADIDRAINEQVGLVAYRGHGSTAAWTHWNNGENYGITNVANLTNGAMTPVVWGVTCSSGAIHLGDCFGEEWMASNVNRGVSYYGATKGSSTNPNNVLIQNLFKRVYDEDFTIQSHAIMLAEDFMHCQGGKDNSWLYLLLGDPEMAIRRLMPGGMTMAAPQTTEICTAPPCWLVINVMDDEGHPLPELIVSAWKPSPPPPEGGSQTWGRLLEQSSEDEVLSNRYSDDNGAVHLPVEPATEGIILITARDDLGRVLTDSVQVVASTATPPPRTGLMLSPRPAVMSDRTTFFFGRAVDTAFQVEIYDSRGRLVRRLDGSSGLDHVLWDGRDHAGRDVGSGVYLVRLIAEQQRLTTKVVRLR